VTNIRITLYQACTTYGPRKLHLRPASAISIAENVAKALPRISNGLPEFLPYYYDISTSKWNILLRPAANS